MYIWGRWSVKQEPINEFLSSDPNSVANKTVNIKSERDKESDDYVVNIEYDQNPGIDEINLEPTDSNEHAADTKPLESEQRTISGKTGTEIVYKHDPDIDIEEFKQEPMNVSEMKSSDPDSVANETLISDHSRYLYS